MEQYFQYTHQNNLYKTRRNKIFNMQLKVKLPDKIYATTTILPTFRSFGLKL